MSSGAGTSESAASAGCSLSEHDRLRPRSNSNNSNHNSNYSRSNGSDSGGNNSSNSHHKSGSGSESSDTGLAVFTWGRGEDGQLGLGDTSDQDEPTYVDALRGVGVRQIACGSGHTVVLSTEGEVYTWGRGDDGRLGHGDNGWKYVPRITRSLAGQVVTQVTCGSYHTAAVTGNGDLYTWYVRC